MNTNNNSDSKTETISWSTKIKYIGTGLAVGVVVAPVVSKILNKIQPRLEEIFDSMTGQTEKFAEEASDLLARAKESVSRPPKAHKPEKTETPEKQPWTKAKRDHIDPV